MHRKTTNIPYYLISLSIIALYSSCNISPRVVPEPVYTPHLLKQGKYILAEGHRVSPDTLPEPEYKRANWQYVSVDALEYLPLDAQETNNGETYSTRATGKKVSDDSLDKPAYTLARGKKVPVRWSEWTPLLQVDRQFPFQHLGIEHGVAGGDVRDFLEDRDGNIWIATLGGGVSIWDGAGFTQLSEKNGLSNNTVYCLLEDREGNIWIGTRDGVNVYDGQVLTQYRREDGLSSNRIKDLLQDEKGNIWMVAHNGINVWDGQGFTTFTQKDGLSGPRPQCILEDSEGRIWIGMKENGLSVWDGKDFTHFDEQDGLSHNTVFDLAEDGEGRIWIATYGGGISIWDGKGFLHYPSNRYVLGIERGKNDHTWLGYAGGEIDAKSEPDEGSVFTVHLPITQNAAAADVEIGDISSRTLGFVGADVARATTSFAPATGDDEAPLALIIEDNPDVLRYLSACLENDYRIATALDGQTGVEMAIDAIPDIIVSDVMMPKKDGYEVCDILKNDERTSHIPIILLTAKADQDSRITGLRAGADAYLAKPFHRRELQVRLEQLIEIRRKLQERYAGLDPQELNDKAYLVEDQFLRKVRQIVEDNLSDANFGLSQLCRAIGLSRSQLFRKLKALTGKSTSLVIRAIRLQRARQLLQTTDLNISEVAYEVGFKDLSYFSRCFQEEYGEAPSAVKG